LGLLEYSSLNDPSPLGRGAGVKERAGVRVCLTHRGRLLGNQVFMRFVD